jgi:hypothetical protein
MSTPCIKRMLWEPVAVGADRVWARIIEKGTA